MDTINTEIKPKLVAFGNPLLDMIVNEKYTKEIIDEYQLNRNIAQERDTISDGLYAKAAGSPGIKICGGGCALNTVRVYQWLVQAATGDASRLATGSEPAHHSGWGQSAVMGGVGHDQGGQLLKKILSNAGVDARLAEHQELPTGHCIALVESAERTLVANLGAANHYNLDDLNTEENLQLLENSKAIYVEGYFLTHSLPVCQSLTKLSRQNNKIFVFNLCGEYVCEDEEYVRNVVSLLPYITYLFGNRSEFKVFLETAKALAIEDPWLQRLTNAVLSGPTDAIILDTNKKKKEWNRIVASDKSHSLTAIVTEGSDNVYCHLISERATKSISYPVPALPSHLIVDTIGAGDSFIAGFLHVLLEGGHLVDAVTNAIWTAQKMIGQLGSSLPTSTVAAQLPWRYVQQHDQQLILAQQQKRPRTADFPAGSGDNNEKPAKSCRCVCGLDADPEAVNGGCLCDSDCRSTCIHSKSLQIAS